MKVCKIYAIYGEFRLNYSFASSCLIFYVLSRFEVGVAGIDGKD